MKKIDITGQVFGRLTALYETERRSNSGYLFWYCLCSCGKNTEATKNSLSRGKVKSCGCLHTEKITTHGLSYNPLYKILHGMKARCYNINSQLYFYYGGRGITVCNEWCNNAKAFIEWCEANGHEKGLEIDRINNDGNYEPSNCRFVTHKENIANRRITVHLLLNKKKTLAIDIAVQLGLDPSTVLRWVKIKRVPKRLHDIVSLIETIY